MCGYTHSARRRAGCRRARVDFRASDVARNATAEWRHLCGDRPYGLQCAAHGRNRRRRRGNAGIGLRCGRTRSLEFTGPLARSRSRCSRRRRTAPGGAARPAAPRSQSCGPSRRVPAPSWPSPAACPSLPAPPVQLRRRIIGKSRSAHPPADGSDGYIEALWSFFGTGLHSLANPGPSGDGLTRARSLTRGSFHRIDSGSYNGVFSRDNRIFLLSCVTIHVAAHQESTGRVEHSSSLSIPGFTRASTDPSCVALCDFEVFGSTHPADRPVGTVASPTCRAGTPLSTVCSRRARRPRLRGGLVRRAIDHARPQSSKYDWYGVAVDRVRGLLMCAVVRPRRFSY